MRPARTRPEPEQGGLDTGLAAETAGEIVGALRAQNVQVAGGAVGAPPYAGGNPAFEQPVEVQGRLTSPEEFGAVVIKTDPVSGAVTRVRDVARVELGAQDVGLRATFNGKRGVALAVVQQPGSNALDAAELVKAEMTEAAKTFPPGITWSVPYNPTDYVAKSVEAVQTTLVEAVLLVVLVVVVFLQTWRAAVIPILAIPIALVGTFAVQLGLGYSLNSLSLFALILDVFRALPRRPFQTKEFIQQCWFIASVTIVPTALVSIPFGAVIALQLGTLTPDTTLVDLLHDGTVDLDAQSRCVINLDPYGFRWLRVSEPGSRRLT